MAVIITNKQNEIKKVKNLPFKITDLDNQNIYIMTQ